MVNNEIRLIIFFAAKGGEALYIQSAETRLGADCGLDQELLIAKFRLKLKKVGKNTRPFRYDLNQIPNDYTVEVRNRFRCMYIYIHIYICILLRSMSMGVLPMFFSWSFMVSSLTYL